MMHMSAQQSPAPSVAANRPGLEQTLDALESRLAELGEALRVRDLAAIDHHSADLHMALATAVDSFGAAQRVGPVPSALRRRLVAASGQVAAQRESLARATSALDRAIDVLMPRDAPACYSAAGEGRGQRLGGAVRA
ncbi:MAG: hypothetical protein OEY03_04685 [Rhizobacter sp.]|nr:hypothetical protein [Rhizobacter sp.]